jgi:ribose transport system substrate-binding protein
MRRPLLALFSAFLGASCAAPHATSTNVAGKQTIALVLNIRSDFWKPSEAGVAQAQKELPDFNLIVRYPQESTPASQIALVHDLVADGVAGIMISTIDIGRESADLDSIGKKIPLIATDSDLPETSRLAFIGSSNEEAGQLAGKIAMKALPHGGKCVGFVGRQAALNSKQRIAGFNEATQGSQITLVDVRDDNGDQASVRQNAAQMLPAHSDVNCMIGFYWYDGSNIYEALKSVGRVGEVKIIAFDDYEATLDAIENGGIAGTVVQQPYNWSYQGMKDLARAVGGDKTWVPADGMVYLPSLVVDRENLKAFRNQQSQY